MAAMMHYNIETSLIAMIALTEMRTVILAWAVIVFVVVSMHFSTLGF